jgi:hypothetical protein
MVLLGRSVEGRSTKEAEDDFRKSLHFKVTLAGALGGTYFCAGLANLVGVLW